VYTPQAEEVRKRRVVGMVANRRVGTLRRYYSSARTVSTRARTRTTTRNSYAERKGAMTVKVVKSWGGRVAWWGRVRVAHPSRPVTQNGSLQGVRTTQRGLRIVVVGAGANAGTLEVV